MTSKNPITHVTSDKPSKRRLGKATRNESAKGDAVQTEASGQAEPILAATAEPETNPPPEMSTTVPPPPVEAETATLDVTLPQPSQPVRKLSALDAAALVLSETGQAMSCAELIAAMAAKDYWSSPKGKTPASTLYAAVQRELKRKGEQARFHKVEPGKFMLRTSP
jgi:hypothetical protein